MVAEIAVPPDLWVVALVSSSKALKGKEDGPATIEKTQVKADEALPLAMDYLM